MRILEAAFVRRAPDDLADTLRKLADMADRGELISMVGAFIANGDYGFVFGASLQDAIVMTELLKAKNLARMVEQ